MKFCSKCDKEYEFEVVSVNGSIQIRDLDTNEYYEACSEAYIDGKKVKVTHIISRYFGSIIATFEGTYMTYFDDCNFVLEV